MPLVTRLDHPYTDASVQLRRGEVMILRGRWTEAEQALSKADGPQLPPAARAFVLNNLAYAMARLGRSDALPIAERALALAKEAKMDETSMVSTLGAALVVSGRHTEAFAILEEASATESEHTRGDRMYWLGRAHRALGRKDEAHEAFTVAASIDGWSTEAARAALAEETPFRS